MTRTEVECIRNRTLAALRDYWEKRHEDTDNHWLDIRQWEATVELHTAACAQLESMKVEEARPIAGPTVKEFNGQADAIEHALAYLKLITFASGDDARHLNRAVSALAAAMKAKGGGA